MFNRPLLSAGKRFKFPYSVSPEGILKQYKGQEVKLYLSRTYTPWIKG